MNAKFDDLSPSLQADFTITRDFRLKPKVSGKFGFTTQHGCPSCDGPLKLESNNGTKGECKKCGRSGILMSELKPKPVVSPSAVIEPTATPSTECPTSHQNGDSSHDQPVGDDSDTPEVEAPKPASVEPPRRIQTEPEPELPHGREPGSDDEPATTPPLITDQKIRRTFVSMREIAKKHPGSKPMMIRDYFPASSIFTIFGEPGSGKTTVVVDAICCIDTGTEWRGKKVSKGIIWYIAAEDPYGVRLRIESWYDANGFIFERDTNMELREDPICFAEPDEVSALIAEVNSVPKEQKPSAIVLDTLADTAGKYDFNKDMGLFCRGFERFRNETGVSIIIIHHCGHAAKDRPRNGSELGGKSDVIMPVKCEDGITTLSVVKLKNGSKEKAKPLSWKMKGLTTKWLDADGEVITSVILEPTESAPKRDGDSMSKTEKIALAALREALRKCGVEDRGIVSVNEDDWRREAFTIGISDAATDDGKRRAFLRAKFSLIQKDIVKYHDNLYWIHPVWSDKTDKTK